MTETALPGPAPFLAAWSLSAPVALKPDGHAHVWQLTRAMAAWPRSRSCAPDPVATNAMPPHGIGTMRDTASVRRSAPKRGTVCSMTGRRGAPPGDPFRAASEVAADARPGQLMADLHRAPTGLTGPFATLAGHARALTEFVPPDGFTPDERAAMAGATALHGALIDSQPPGRIRLLHGDLHHDNVPGSGESWSLIDPKAVIGDVRFEPANAFRNPRGGRRAAGEGARIARRADLRSAALDLDRSRLLGRAAAKCALSIASACHAPSAPRPRPVRAPVRAPSAPRPRPDLALLPVLLAQL